jgi:hypothetical protein
MGVIPGDNKLFQGSLIIGKTSLEYCFIVYFFRVVYHTIIRSLQAIAIFKNFQE